MDCTTVPCVLAAGGDPDGVEYSGGVTQHTCLVIAAAADDVNAVFGVGTVPLPMTASQSIASSSQASYGRASNSQQGNATIMSVLGGSFQAQSCPPDAVTALVSQWAAHEAHACGVLLCRHALAPFQASAAAPGALLCVNLAMAFLAALELSHGLSLQEGLVQALWPMLQGTYALSPCACRQRTSSWEMNEVDVQI